MAKKENDDEVNHRIARQLRTRRRLLRMTQREVGEGMRPTRTAQQIQKYESGTNNLSAAILWQLSQILEVSIDYFYAGLERTTPSALQKSGSTMQRTGT